MQIRHILLHRSRYARDCPACDAQRAAYARLDAAMARVIPELNYELEMEGSDLRLEVFDEYPPEHKAG